MRTLRTEFEGGYLKAVRSKTDSFMLQLLSIVTHLSNDDCSRHFACIPVDESCLELVSEIIHKVDKCLKEFDLPVYYEEHLVHTSLLWKTAEFTIEEKNFISSALKKNFVDSLSIDRISCKTGNKMFEIKI